MSYAQYRDPSEPDFLWDSWPSETPTLAYWRLVDLTPEQLQQFDPNAFPVAAHITAEIHPEQWDSLPFTVDRVSVVLEKSGFGNLTLMKQKLETVECDITFNWDHRFSLSYYQKMLQYWIYYGVQHFSFYDLQKFHVWQQLNDMLMREGYHFYDRYHACLPGHQSRYQKHIARMGDLYALGGWSRVTEDGVTRTRGPRQKEWDVLNAVEQTTERLLFAMADRDGLPLSELNPEAIEKACNSGLARVVHDRLSPTEEGLWDTVGLVSHLQ